MKRNYISSLLLFLSLIAIWTACSDQKKKLLFIGDSIIADDTVDPKYRFPSLIEQQLPGFKTIIQERPGWTTSSFLENWEVVEDDFPSRADLVFIQLGASDLQQLGSNDSTVTHCILNIYEIMERIKHHFPNADLVLMSSTKIDYLVLDTSMEDAGFDERTNEYLSRIGEGYSIIASENECNFIDLHRLVPIKSTYDGVHLNKNGHKIVADVILRFLREYMLLDQST